MPLSENQKTIAIWRDGRRKLFDAITNVVRQALTIRKQKSAAEVLFEDDFVQETGIDVSTPEGKQALADAKMLHIQRAQHQAQQIRLQREWREMQGSLAEFDDFAGPMGDLPGDDEIADALCNDNPELTQYRGNVNNKF